MPSVSDELPGTDVPAVGLREDRDRFVAFAFCAADMLLELDSRRFVTYAGGATVALTGKAAEELAGKKVYDLVPSGERSLLQESLDEARAGGRIEGSRIDIAGALDTPLPMLLSGYYLPDLGGRYFLALRLQSSEPEAIGRSAELDVTPAILTAAEFVSVGEARLLEARKRGETAVLTVLELQGLASLTKRLAESSRAELMTTVTETLHHHSLGGDSAAKLGMDRYGLLHHPDLDVDGLRTKIGHAAKKADPERQGIDVKSATVDVVSEHLAEGDSTRAFLHAVHRIKEMGDEGLTFERLSNELPREMQETARRIGDTRSVINAHAFDLAFQPVVDLTTWQIHHFEVLVRLRGADAELSPYQFVRFAEEVGMVREFDLAVCHRVLQWLHEAKRMGKSYCLAVNLSGRSLSSMDFVADLLTLLRDHDWSKSSLMFELTESANIADLVRTNKIIQSLRRTGHQVCLDDFGAGEAAFHYLRSLDVDMVKIDGSYVREALTNRKDRMFLKSIASLCHDLKITTIAEMIEQHKSIEMVRKCGIKFGQGYLFGRPSLDITSFDPNRSLRSRPRQSGTA